MGGTTHADSRRSWALLPMIGGACRRSISVSTKRRQRMSVQPQLEPTTASPVQRHDTVVIGGGQAGLATGYHLAPRGVPFVILHAKERTRDSLRARWGLMPLFHPPPPARVPGPRLPA